MRLLLVIYALPILGAAADAKRGPFLRFGRRDASPQLFPRPRGIPKRSADYSMTSSSSTSSIIWTNSSTSSTSSSTIEDPSKTKIPSTSASTSSEDGSTSQTTLPCSGTAPYGEDNVPSTEYITITEGYETTVTNPADPLITIIETPGDFCSTTEVLISTTAAWCGRPPCVPPPAPPAPTYTTKVGQGGTTVIVTKKTPQVVAVSPTSPPDYSDPTPPATRVIDPPPVTKSPDPPAVAPPVTKSPDPPATVPPGEQQPPAQNPPSNPGGSSPGGVGGQPDPSPITTTVQGVPIIAGPSSVRIGGQIVPITALTQPETTVVANGQVFTVRPSAIIGGGALIVIPTGLANNEIGNSNVIAGEANKLSPVTIGTLTVSVSPNFAIIDGTTYAIGSDSNPTTITYHGTKISIGPNGVGLPSTTIAPVSSGPYSTAVIDGITVLIGSSVAIIDGKTYPIGALATRSGNTGDTTIVINGHTLTIGASGVIAKTTTAKPYSGLASAGATATVNAAKPTSTSNSDGINTENSSNSIRRSGIFGSLQAAVAALCAGVLLHFAAQLGTF